MSTQIRVKFGSNNGLMYNDTMTLLETVKSNHNNIFITLRGQNINTLGLRQHDQHFADDIFRFNFYGIKLFYVD